MLIDARRHVAFDDQNWSLEIDGGVDDDVDDLWQEDSGFLELHARNRDKVLN